MRLNLGRRASRLRAWRQATTECCRVVGSSTQPVENGLELLVPEDGLREFDVLRDMETRLLKLKEEVDEAGPEMPDVSMPRTFTDGFAQEVASILAAWKVPGCDRVSFDAKVCDIQLNDKLRGSQVKGLRALTHAAFVIGLMTYCLKNGRPHPGFVVIDSPLLSYRGMKSKSPSWPSRRPPSTRRSTHGLQRSFRPDRLS